MLPKKAAALRDETESCCSSDSTSFRHQHGGIDIRELAWVAQLKPGSHIKLVGAVRVQLQDLKSFVCCQACYLLQNTHTHTHTHTHTLLLKYGETLSNTIHSGGIKQRANVQQISLQAINAQGESLSIYYNTFKKACFQMRFERWNRWGISDINKRRREGRKLCYIHIYIYIY